MPDAVGGEFPDAPRVAGIARGLRLVIRQQQQAAAPAAPPPSFGPPVQVGQRMSHSNFRVNFTNAEVVLLPASAQRGYFLVVNVGAADVFLAFDRTADAVSGIPIVATTGFLELPHGTVSEVRALTTGTAQLVVIEGLYYPALPAAV